MLNLDAVNPDYPIPDYLFKGQTVYAPYNDTKCVKCLVEVAHGDAAQVVNENYKFNKLVSRYHLRIKRGDPKGVISQ